MGLGEPQEADFFAVRIHRGWCSQGSAQHSPLRRRGERSSGFLPGCQLWEGQAAACFPWRVDAWLC